MSSMQAMGRSLYPHGYGYEESQFMSMEEASSNDERSSTTMEVASVFGRLDSNLICCAYNSCDDRVDVSDYMGQLPLCKDHRGKKEWYNSYKKLDIIWRENVAKADFEVSDKIKIKLLNSAVKAIDLEIEGRDAYTSMIKDEYLEDIRHPHYVEELRSKKIDIEKQIAQLSQSCKLEEIQSRLNQLKNSVKLKENASKLKQLHESVRMKELRRTYRGI